jgi:type II secretory pathway pseudopilin PulG
MAIPGVALLALTILGLLAAALATVLAIVKGRTRVARGIVLVSGAWVAAFE